MAIQPARENFSQEEIKEILQRNVDLFKDEPGFAQYFTELTMYLMNNNAQSPPAPAIPPRPPKDEIPGVGRVDFSSMDNVDLRVFLTPFPEDDPPTLKEFQGIPNPVSPSPGPAIRPASPLSVPPAAPSPQVRPMPAPPTAQPAVPPRQAPPLQRPTSPNPPVLTDAPTRPRFPSMPNAPSSVPTGNQPGMIPPPGRQGVSQVSVPKLTPQQFGGPQPPIPPMRGSSPAVPRPAPGAFSPPSAPPAPPAPPPQAAPPPVPGAPSRPISVNPRASGVFQLPNAPLITPIGDALKEPPRSVPPAAAQIPADESGNHNPASLGRTKVYRVVRPYRSATSLESPCPVCGSMVPMDQALCPGCGHQMH